MMRSDTKQPPTAPPMMDVFSGPESELGSCWLGLVVVAAGDAGSPVVLVAWGPAVDVVVGVLDIVAVGAVELGCVALGCFVWSESLAHSFPSFAQV